MLLSIVIPCYKSAKTIRKVVETSMEVIDKIEDLDCEFVLVNDFSQDGTDEAIWQLARDYPNVKGISLAKNFGQHNAIMAGLHETSGDYIMGMDDDMQTHPSQIPAFIEKMREGYDVVFGIYRKRKFSFAKNFFSKIASFIMWHMVERPKGLEASNFWCCRRYVRDELVRYDGYNLYLQILFYRTTGNIANIEIEHFSREEGKSNYNFMKSLKLFMTFMNYTVVPLRMATIVGTLLSMTGFIATVAIFVRKLLDPEVTLGWSSLMCVIMLLFGFAFLILGVIGEYIGKLILNISRTPQYVIRKTINIEEKACPAPQGQVGKGGRQEKTGPAPQGQEKGGHKGT